MLAQLCFASDPEHAFELLLEAERIDQSFAAQGADHPAHWRFVLYVWLVGAADHAGEPEAAFDYAGRARALAENGEGVATGEAFTLAEFVALPKHAELRDCGLVDWLFETYPIEAEYRADHGELIDQVLAACEL